MINYGANSYIMKQSLFTLDGIFICTLAVHYHAPIQYLLYKNVVYLLNHLTHLIKCKIYSLSESTIAWRLCPIHESLKEIKLLPSFPLFFIVERPFRTIFSALGLLNDPIIPQITHYNIQEFKNIYDCYLVYNNINYYYYLSSSLKLFFYVRNG